MIDYLIYLGFIAQCVSNKDYLHAVNVWNMFEIKTMGDSHYLNLKTDVILLAHVFEKFISMCIECYGLDLYHCFSSPGLSWHAMLQMNCVTIELISDIDMCLFVEKGIRGDISFIAKRYSKASEKNIKSYDDSKSSKYIKYLGRIA